MRNTTASNILALASAAGILFLLGETLASLACWAIYLPVALTAWPIWRYQKERSLLHRRAILDSVSLENSSIKQWLWSGHLLVVWQVFVALAFAILLLAFLPPLKPWDWLVLGIDALLLAVLAKLLSRRLEGQIRSEYRGRVVRMWPLFWLNVLLLAIGFMAVDGFLVGAPDMRTQAWNEIAEQAFAAGSSEVSCRIAGWVVGLLSALDQLTWYASQKLIPVIPGLELKLAAWGLVLLQAGILGYVYTRYQMGVLALIEQRQLCLSALTGKSTFSKAFVVTILVLAMPYLYVSLKLQDFDPKMPVPAVLETNPCKPDQHVIKALESSLGVELQKARSDARQRASKDVDKAVDEVFADVERGVDRYLDWYFTVIGEYERLAAMATGDFANMMTRELNRTLFGDTRLDDRLEKARQRIAGDSQKQLTELAGHLAGKIRSEAAAGPCQIGTLDMSALGDLDRDQFRAKVAAGGGVLAGTVTAKLLTKKTAGVVVSKLAAKQTFKVAAGLAGKVAAKEAGAIALSAAGATAICSPTGPFAIACGIGAGIVTWLTIDKVAIEIDEARFRAEMRAEILKEVQVSKTALALALKSQQYAAIDRMTLLIQNTVGETFIPARDGL